MFQDDLSKRPASTQMTSSFFKNEDHFLPHSRTGNMSSSEQQQDKPIVPALATANMEHFNEPTEPQRQRAWDARTLPAQNDRSAISVRLFRVPLSNMVSWITFRCRRPNKHNAVHPAPCSLSITSSNMVPGPFGLVYITDGAEEDANVVLGVWLC